MRTCFGMDPLTLDPRKSGDQVTSLFLSMLYEGLIRLNPDGSTELALAESYQVSDDGLTYEFLLREAYWSNGDPVCAKDFEVSWKSSLDSSSANPLQHLFFVLRNGEKAAKGECLLEDVGVCALDPRTLHVNLEGPSAHFFSLISLCNFFPVPSSFETKLKHSEWIDPATIPVNGPFRVISWQKRELIRLKKNPIYWDRNNVLLNELVIYICNNPHLTAHLFDEENIDFMSNIFSHLSNELLQQYSARGLVRSIPMGGTAFCSFNTEVFPFHNKKIRNAFSLAINREELAKEIGCFVTPAKRVLPPPLAKGKGAAELTYNPSLALQSLQQGMRELGIISSEKTEQLDVRLFFENLTLSFENTIDRSKIAHALQKQWRQALKLQVKLEGTHYQSHLQKLYSGSYTMGLGYWLCHYMDPLDVLERFKNKNVAKNYPRFENKDYAKSVTKINRIMDLSSRIDFINRAEDILIQEAPIAPLYHFEHVLIARPDLISGISYLPNGCLRFTQCNQISSRADHEKTVQV